LVSRSFVCRDGIGLLTWRDGEHVHRLRCTPKGCRRERGVLGSIDAANLWLAATLRQPDGSERVVVVWESRRGPVLARIGKLEQLAAAPNLYLFDSPERGGPQTRDLQAFVGEDRVTFLFRARGVHGLRIDVRGKVTRLGP